MMMQTGVFLHTETNPSAIVGGDIGSFTQITFPAPFPPGDVPIVIPFVQTFNGPETPGIRIAEINNTGFKFRVNEVVVYKNNPLSDGRHDEEKIGWVAFSTIM